MIKINISNDLLLYAIDKLVPSQGSLKELSKQDYEKLKNSILEFGFTSPFFIWFNEQSIPEILDGHQRQLTIIQMEKEGHEMPEKFPCIEIKAKSREEASRILLALTSQFGQMTTQGLYEYMSDNNISIEEVQESYRLIEIEMVKFEMEYFGEPSVKDSKLDNFEEPIKNVKQTICPHCGEII